VTYKINEGHRYTAHIAGDTSDIDRPYVLQGTCPKTSAMNGQALRVARDMPENFCNERPKFKLQIYIYTHKHTYTDKIDSLIDR
jgi:hypothetical protein